MLLRVLSLSYPGIFYLWWALGESITALGMSLPGPALPNPLSPCPPLCQLPAQPSGMRIPREHLDGRCSSSKRGNWAHSGPAADPFPPSCAQQRGWGGECSGMAEPGDGALEAPGICCSVCLPLPCCFPGMPPSICQAAPLQKRQRWLVGAPRRWKRKSWEVHRVSPLSFPPRHCLST